MSALRWPEWSEAAADAVLGWLARAGWQFGLLALALLAVERLAARWLTPRWTLALWTIVLAPLLLPVLPAVPGALRWELPAFVEEAPARLAARGARPVEAPSIPGDAGGSESAEGRPGRSSAPSATRSAGPEPVGAAAPEEAPGLAGAARGGSTLAPPLPGRVEAAGEAIGARASLALVALWLAGVLALALRGLAAEHAFRRRLAREAPTRDPRLLALVAELRARCGVRRPVELVVTELVASPAVAGWRRPLVLLPRAVAERLGERALRHVLAHELAHVRHGDVAQGAAALLVRCLWWFHPLVHLALAHRRSAQEAARDHEAVERLGEGSLSYARTMLELLAMRPPARRDAPALGFLESGDTKRRILMLVRTPRSPRLARVPHVPHVIGTALVVAFGWGALAAGAPERLLPLPQGEPGPSGRTAPLREIAVERSEPEPEWKRDLRAALARPISVSYVDLRPKAVLDDLRARSGVNLIVSGALLADRGEERIDLALEEAPLGSVLRRVCERLGGDVGSCLARGAVFVGFVGEIPGFFELRFYDVEPLLAPAGEEEREEMAEHLVDLVRTFASPSTWEEFSGPSIQLWNDVLLVEQTDAVHAQVLAFLNLLLNGGAGPPAEPEPWRARLREQLAQPASLDAEAVPLGQVAQRLQEQHGVAIHVHPDWAEEPVTLQLEGVPLATVLAFLGDFSEPMLLRDGAVLLGALSPPEIAAFPIGDLLGDDEWREERRDGLVDLLRQSNSLVEHWGDLMIASNSPEALASIESFLATMRRVRAD